jgi:hypothetical protein
MTRMARVLLLSPLRVLEVFDKDSRLGVFKEVLIYANGAAIVLVIPSFLV